MKNKLKSFACIAMSLALALGILSGCMVSGAKETLFEDDYDPNKQYEIRFFGWGDAQEQNIYQRVIDDFMSEYPNIKVNYEATAAGSYMSALIGQINDLPDVFYLPDTEFLQWASSGRLLNINGGVKQEVLEKVWDSAIEEYFYNPKTYQLGYSEGAGQYGLPKDLGPFTLVYNKKMLDRQIAANNLQNDADVKALLSAQPQQWDVFRSALKKLSQGLPMNTYGIYYYELEHAVYSNNAQFFNEDATTASLDSTAFIDAIQFIADLSIVDKTMPKSTAAIASSPYESFLGGQSMFTFMGPWDCATFWDHKIGTEQLEFDIIPCPYGPGPDRAYKTADDGKSTAFRGSMSYSLASSTMDRGSAGAALRLAEYLCTNEAAQRKFYSLGQSIPNLKDMAYNEYIPNSLGVFTGNQLMPKNRNVFVDIVDGFKDADDKIGSDIRVLYHTYYTDWRTNLEDMLYTEGVWDGKKTAQQVLESYNSVFQGQLDEMQSDMRG